MTSYSSNCKEYYMKNREKIIQVSKEYIKKRKITDPLFKLRNKIYQQNYNKNKIYRDMKKQKKSKEVKVEKSDIPKNLEELKNKSIVIKISVKKEDLIVYI